MFAGPGSRTDLPSQLRRRGWEVTAVDTKLGGWSHDLTRKEVADRLVAWVGGGRFDLVFIATPCASYSVAHRPQLRSRRSPGRVAGVRPEWDAYLAKHEKLAEVSVRLMPHRGGARGGLRVGAREPGGPREQRLEGLVASVRRPRTAVGAAAGG